MLVWCFWLTITFVLLGHLSFDLGINASISGPYRTTVVDIKVCENPSRPFMKDPPMVVTMKLSNTSTNVLLGGNINILRDTKDAKSKLLGLVDVNGKWKTVIVMNHTACHGVLVPYICAIAGIKYDRTRRIYAKGQYSFKNLDINAIQHLFIPKVEYGKAMWIFEGFHARLGTFYCNEFYTVTEPVA